MEALKCIETIEIVANVSEQIYSRDCQYQSKAVNLCARKHIELIALRLMFM